MYHSIIHSRDFPREEMTWYRMVDLPGYGRWSGGYVGLDRIILDLPEYYMLLHPDELSGPLDHRFEEEFQNVLDSVYEHFAHQGVPHHSLSDYKKGGRFDAS